MANDARSVIDLPVRTSLVGTDQIVCVSNAAGANGGNVSLISIQNLVGNSNFVKVGQADPANSTANTTVTQGSVFFSNTFGYVAIANGVLRRFSISSF